MLKFGAIYPKLKNRSIVYMGRKNRKNCIKQNVDDTNNTQEQPTYMYPITKLLYTIPQNTILLNFSEYTNLKNENAKLKMKLFESNKHKDDLLNLIIDKSVIDGFKNRK